MGAKITRIYVPIKATDLFLARLEVGSHDAGLLSGDDLAGEHTPEGVETALVGRRHHLAHVHHQRCFGVTTLLQKRHRIS